MAEMANATLRDVQLIFRNFAGSEGPYNRKGDRNFNVVLDEDTANAMAADGWNVKRLKPRAEDPDDEGRFVLPVSIRYGNYRPPTVGLIASGRRTNLGEQDIDMLDYADITHVDLIVRPYEWEVNGKSGVKAYLYSIYVTIDEDELAREYNQLPSTSQESYADIEDNG